MRSRTEAHGARERGIDTSASRKAPRTSSRPSMAARRGEARAPSRPSEGEESAHPKKTWPRVVEAKPPHLALVRQEALREVRQRQQETFGRGERQEAKRARRDGQRLVFSMGTRASPRAPGWSSMPRSPARSCGEAPKRSTWIMRRPAEHAGWISAVTARTRPRLKARWRPLDAGRGRNSARYARRPRRKDGGQRCNSTAPPQIRRRPVSAAHSARADTAAPG